MTYPIVISDTSGLQLSPAGSTALGAGVGAVLGYFLGKGKPVPLLLGAGLGYIAGNTGIVQQLIGQKTA